MRATRFTFVTLFLALFALAGIARAQSQMHHLSIHMVAETDSPRAGSTLSVALVSVPEPGWHGYWINPGDAGFPATLDWTLPGGVTASPAAYPMPGRLVIAGLMNYVFEKPYAPLVTLTIPAGLAEGTPLPVKLHAQFLVCSASVCVPESANLSLSLKVGDGQIAPARQARFDGWRQAIPKPIGTKATYQVTKNQIRLAIPYPAGAPLNQGYFFPVSTDVIAYSAPQHIQRVGNQLLIETKVTAAAAGPIKGVLKIAPEHGLAVTAIPGNVPPLPAKTASSTGTINWHLVLVTLAGAILGGLILNIMPCVFPILCLKALSLANASVGESRARRDAIAYTLGVVLVCVALGAIILGLRAGGAAVGWAFQLQDPRTIVILLLLVTAISFNLAGLFELPTPRLVQRGHGAASAFATGALAAFIATPCTGPFMGVALGAALSLPSIAALAVFAGLGLGLALPFLAIAFIPALRRRLPKPGSWMETFRHILSVPMFLTAIGLAWVLGKQAGLNGQASGLIAMLALVVLLWIAGLRQRRGRAVGWLLLALMLVVTIAAVLSIAPARHSTDQPLTGNQQAFSEGELAQLRAHNRPVFVYFTADWCLTCKVNEKAVIDTFAVQSALKAHNVAVLVGDWTDGDPVIGRFIETHNRAGVPLYLYYAPGAADPRILPQILTPSMLKALAAS